MARRSFSQHEHMMWLQNPLVIHLHRMLQEKPWRMKKSNPNPKSKRTKGGVKMPSRFCLQTIHPLAPGSWVCSWRAQHPSVAKPVPSEQAQISHWTLSVFCDTDTAPARRSLSTLVSHCLGSFRSQAPPLQVSPQTSQDYQRHTEVLSLCPRQPPGAQQS